MGHGGIYESFLPTPGRGKEYSQVPHVTFSHRRTILDLARYPRRELLDRGFREDYRHVIDPAVETFLGRIIVSKLLK